MVQNMRKIKKAVPQIENAIKIKIGVGFRKKMIDSGSVSIKGSELNEYLVEQIIRAIDFGFCVDDALLLLKEEFVLEFINVKGNTKRKNLRDVRSRIIGTRVGRRGRLRS